MSRCPPLALTATGLSEDKHGIRRLNTSRAGKIRTSLLIPLTAALAGFYINRTLKTSEQSLAPRSDVYKKFNALLNDIQTCLLFVGRWKELSPIDIIKRKRQIDTEMHTCRPATPFFSKEL